MKEPLDAGDEAGVAAGAAAPDPTAATLEDEDDGVEAGDGVGETTVTAELGDSGPVTGVEAGADGVGLDGAAEADAPFGVAAANQAVTHPW